MSGGLTFVGRLGELEFAVQFAFVPGIETVRVRLRVRVNTTLSATVQAAGCCDGDSRWWWRSGDLLLDVLLLNVLQSELAYEVLLIARFILVGLIDYRWMHYTVIPAINWGCEGGES